MIRNHRLLLLLALGLNIVGCTDPDVVDDLWACKREGDVVTLTVTSPAPAIPPTAELLVRGTVEADIRIRELRVAGVRATGLRDNFADWEVKIPLDVLHAMRVGTTSELTVQAIDVCGTEHLADLFVVPIHAPSNTPATGLDLAVAHPAPGDCYIPANGSARATLTLTADKAAIGVPVLLTPAKGVLSSASAVSGTTMSVVLAEAVVNETSIARAVAELRVADGKDDIVTVVAGAGGVSIASPTIQVAAAPTITRPVSAPVRGQAFPLYVATSGRLQACTAEVSHQGAADARYAHDQKNLVGETVTAPENDECGQKLVVEVVFAEDAPDFAFVSLTCSDAFDQRVRHEVFVELADEPGDTSTGP